MKLSSTLKVIAASAGILFSVSLGSQSSCEEVSRCVALSSQDTERAVSEDETYVLRLMDLVQSPLKKPQRVKVAALAADAGQIMPLSERRSWYVLLAVESKYVQTAESHAGAVGIGQIVAIDVPYLQRITGVRFSKSDLVKKPSVNLAVSAGFYWYLVRTMRSKVVALVAYNSGANSSYVRDIRRITAINHETANYVAKHAYLSEAAESVHAGLGPTFVMAD